MERNLGKLTADLIAQNQRLAQRIVVIERELNGVKRDIEDLIKKARAGRPDAAFNRQA